MRNTDKINSLHLGSKSLQYCTLNKPQASRCSKVTDGGSTASVSWTTSFSSQWELSQPFGTWQLFTRYFLEHLSAHSIFTSCPWSVQTWTSLLERGILSLGLAIVLNSSLLTTVGYSSRLSHNSNSYCRHGCSPPTVISVTSWPMVSLKASSVVVLRWYRNCLLLDEF